MTKRRDNKGRNLRDGETQGADGRYRFRYVDCNGVRRSIYSWKLVSTDEPPAGKKNRLSLRELEEAIQIDANDGIDTAKARKTTLNALFDRYMESKRELKNSTKNRYNMRYNAYVRESIGKRSIADLKYSHLKAFYNGLVYDKGLAASTISNVNAVLHPVFTIAVRDGYIKSDPTAGIMREIHKNFKGQEKTKRHALTEEQQETLIDFLKAPTRYNRYLQLFTVLLGTGARIGEITGLRWRDVDFKNETISINHNLTYEPTNGGKSEFHISTTKTNAGFRTIPMMREVKKALMQERETQLKCGGCKSVVDGCDDFVFTNNRGHLYHTQSFDNSIQHIIENCNKWESERAKREHRHAVNIPNFSAHNLRHTFCTRFCENETDIKVIQEIMGHEDISTTMNIYAEATAKRKKQSLNALEGKIKIS